MQFAVATRALFLLAANFYDDFILATKADLESAANFMELLFMITGWEFARDGKKATSFAKICRALGVELNFDSAGERILEIYDTKQRVEDLVTSIDAVFSSGKLT